jgi:trans-aconitate methyltransferase
MGDNYPSAEVIGIDNSNSMPNMVPQNVKFYRDNFNLPEYCEDKSYDLIHAREILRRVLDPPGLIRKCFESAKPMLNSIYFLLMHY